MDALNILKTRISACLKRVSDGKLFVFLDIIKAYDAVWIKGLLHKMISLHIPVFYVKLINVWLSNRSAYAKSGCKRSTKVHLFKGLPQGGVLCCILWAIFINDLPDCILSFCEYILFADDVQLSSLKGGQDGIIQMQKALAAVRIWGNKWRLTRSGSKSVYMRVNISTSPLSIILYDTPLEEVDSSKYLGLTFNRNGTWKHHWLIKYNKAKQTANLILKFSIDCSLTVSPAFSALLCRQVLQSSFFYGFPIWSPPESLFPAADKAIIKPFLKSIGCPWNAGTLLGFIEAGIMPIAFYWDYHALLFGRRILHWKSVKSASHAAITKEINGPCNVPYVRGISPFGSYLKWLESQWSVSVTSLSKYILKKRRQNMFKKFITSLNSSSSASLLKLRDSYFNIPSYLCLPRSFAACIFRFRINYGPDLASLQSRGLLRDFPITCRLCGKGDESRNHLLCECLSTRSRIPPAWRCKCLRFFISDCMHSEDDYFRIIAHLKGIADALAKIDL